MLSRITLQLVAFTFAKPYLISSTLRIVTHTNKTLSHMSTLRYSLIESAFFLKDYYLLNDMIWQDGFLIDFLQKKVADRWVRGFVIHSGYLFNERWLFDYVVRFYITLVIWPGYRINIYEFDNVAATLLITLFLAISIFLVLSLLYFGTAFI